MKLYELIRKHKINLRNLATDLDTSESKIRFHLNRELGGSDMNIGFRSKLVEAIKKRSTKILADLNRCL